MRPPFPSPATRPCNRPPADAKGAGQYNRYSGGRAFCRCPPWFFPRRIRTARVWKCSGQTFIVAEHSIIHTHCSFCRKTTGNVILIVIDIIASCQALKNQCSGKSYLHSGCCPVNTMNLLYTGILYCVKMNIMPFRSFVKITKMIIRWI